MIRLDDLRVLFYLIKQFIKPYWVFSLLLVFLSFITAILLSLQPLVIAPIMDATFTTSAEPASSLAELNLNNLGQTLLYVFGLEGSENPLTLILFTAILYVVVAASGALLEFVTYLLSAWIGTSAYRDMQITLHRHLMTLSMAYFIRQKAGDLVSRFVNDASEAATGLDLALRQMLQSIVQLLFYGLLLFRTAPGLAVATLLVSLLHLGITRFLRDKIRHRTTARFDAIAEISTRVQESLVSIRVIKSFASEVFESRRFAKSARGLHQRVMRFWVYKHAESPLRGIADAVAIAVVMVLAFATLQAGRLLLPGFVLFVFLARQTIAPASLLAQSFIRFQVGLGSARSVLRILANKPDLVDGQQEASPLSDAIRVDNVSFAYQSDLPVLTNINLKINQGEVVALVGHSGAGKSTLIDLILRLYDPTEGRVTLDGVDVRQFTQESYRRLFGVVSQETLLFNTTIRENISYGRPVYHETAITRAAGIANADKFIERLPEGYNTLVGDRGIRLSGGQRQRIAIARAIYGNPKILILDEATSSLDTESERLVQQAIDRVLEHMTAIVIAHRLSTVINAHKIVVLDKGKIQAVGPHAMLLETSPTYRKLHALQFSDDSLQRKDDTHDSDLRINTILSPSTLRSGE